jgi:hypothetical protein
MDKITIRKKYIDYVLDKGEKPKSVHAFAKTMKMGESDFYNYYASFESIEKDVWKSLFTETLEQLESDETYRGYPSKDKLLAFYYLWISKLRENRSYILTFKNDHIKSIPMNATGLDDFKKLFVKYAEVLVNEGIEAKEISERKFISDKYTYGFWLQTMFVLNYWVNDSSDNFEMTDAAIEKAVNLGFKLIGDNALDSVIDFGKFILQRAV